MSYILKDSTQGQIAVKLTDAGRRKLSEGRLNIELFQLGDSEMCYDCYNTILNQTDGLNVQQANFNAQNLNPVPQRNKAHVKYPIPLNSSSTGSTFGAAQPAHNYQDIFNTATERGFFTGGSEDCCSFSAQTTSAYTLNSNFYFPVSAMTGGSSVVLLSAATYTNQAFESYSPVVGDLISVHYVFYTGATGDSTTINCTASSANLFYQVISGNTNSAQTNTTLTLSVDREIPNFLNLPVSDIGPFTGANSYAYVKVYPSTSGGTYLTTSTNPMLTYFGADTPIPYWSPGSLSFENNCDVSVTDVKVWNMNINWTEQVAGVLSVNDGWEPVEFYGSTGYCGTKEYLGYNSSEGQTDTGTVSDFYNGTQSSSFYRDSYKNIRTVTPERQKAIAILHYTNQTISNFYGEKFATELDGSTQTGIGEAKNFRLSLPWLMWHKKYDTNISGCVGASTYGQCFYVDPPGFNVFPSEPLYMRSSPNPNMNDHGLRYYHLWDDNSGVDVNGNTVGQPNRVGKVFPDLKMVVIDDEELVAAMSYKSNRSWTLPAPRTTLIPAGTNCVGSASTLGIFTQENQRLYLTYLMESNSGLTTGMHCNYYVPVDNPNDGNTYDLQINFGNEFPYLRPFINDQENGTGWQANRIHVIYQLVNLGDDPQPDSWRIVEVTEQLDGYNLNNNIPLSGCVITSAGTNIYLTRANQDTGSTYNYDTYVNIPSATTESNLLQFGDEYFLYGSLQTDIQATIYEMQYYVNLASNQFAGNVNNLSQGNSLNPTYQKYFDDNGVYPNVYLTEVGLYDNENGFPDLMAIAKFMNPQLRQGAQQFVLKLDF
jgi:hypothetical protein